MAGLKTYNIQFEALKEGTYQYDFEVDDTFFTLFENTFISSGKFKIKIDLTKSTTMLLLDFNIKGKINTLCDRCSEDLAVPVATKNRIIVKFGDEISESEDIVILPHGAYEINVAQLIYELISVNFPQRNVHSKGKCNMTTIHKLEELETKYEKEIDPRWEKLQKIK